MTDYKKTNWYFGKLIKITVFQVAKLKHTGWYFTAMLEFIKTV